MLDDGNWLSIYDKHAPIIAAVSPCEVLLEDTDGSLTRLEIGKGVLHQLDGTVTVYVNQRPKAGAKASFDMQLESIERLSKQLMDLLRYNETD